MQKMFGRTIFYFIMLTFLSSPSGYCAEQDPIKFLTDFYTWYIPAQGVMYPEYHRDIYLYVARDTVEELKKRPVNSGCDRTDYFIKLDDTPVDMKGVRILVDQVEDIGPDTLVATVTIVQVDKVGHRFPDGVIIVVLKKIKGELKIFKCIDAYPEA
ncbi:hypothetical protein JCM15519_21650 [Fundidesulfovibrio butyratiphilus]